jgi:neutral ceramidase
MYRRLAILACFLLVCGSGRSADFQAGAAAIDITPPAGFAMWGYAARHDRPSTGVLDPLRARALVLATDKEKIALVSLDLGRAPSRTSTAAVRQRVRAATGIEHLFLVASHTHHGPVLELDNWPTPEHSYVHQLEDRLVEVITEAAGKVQPARIGVAERQVPFNRNRHSKRADKPVDRDFLVLRVENAAGQPIAHAINFAAHATLQDAKQLKFSADYPGALAATVEKETGVPCLFLQGAAGDLSANPGSLRGPGEFGDRLGREALELAGTIHCTRPHECKLQVAEEDFQLRSRIDLQNPLVKALFVRAFFKDLVDFYEREYQQGVRPHLTVALLGGRIGLVGVSGEFFCSHAIQLKRRARLEHLFFLGYCNDYQQYFPTIEAAAEGGYGADPGVANAEVGAGEHIMDRALIHLYALGGKLAGVR